MSDPETSAPSARRLLLFARELLSASTFTELLDVAKREAAEALGYSHVWLMVADDPEAKSLRLLDYSGDRREIVWEVAPVLETGADPFLAEVISSDEPVIVEDARTDPRTNKTIVGQLQNRTIIKVPLRMIERPFGVFGLGTFGDEGCRAPTAQQLEYIIGMAAQITLAAGRIRFVEERERALSERQQLERRLMMMQRLDSLGMLAGGIAHDFNNLLTVILAGTSMAYARAHDDVQREDLEAVTQAADRAQQLTKKLLAMSRRQELILQPIDLNGHIGALLDMLKRLLPREIKTDLIGADKLPLIEGDRVQLDQVFMNICLNARDAMPQGGRLTIETEQVLVNGEYVRVHPWAKRGRYVLVTVTDTGTGMSPETLERLFEPFYTTKSGNGTGLGLAVAHGIVTQHGGMVHAYSELGVGSTIKVYLPAHERRASDVGTKIAGEVPIARGGEQVLLAEDDTGVRTIASRILEQAGYRVSVVGNGDRACAVAEQKPIALAILDVVMPGLPCSDLVARLRLLRPGIRILLASGYPASSSATDLAQALALPLLGKPYDPDSLLRAVRRALDS